MFSLWHPARPDSRIHLSTPAASQVPELTEVAHLLLGLLLWHRQGVGLNTEILVEAMRVEARRMLKIGGWLRLARVCHAPVHHFQAALPDELV